MRHLILALVLSLLAMPQCGAQLLRQSELTSINLGRDADPDLDVGIWVVFDEHGNRNDADYWWQYFVGSGMIINRLHGKILHSESGSLVHIDSSLISTNLFEYRPSHTAFHNELGVVNYLWTAEKGGILRYFPGADIFPGQLACIVAFKFEDWDGWHVGWVRFRRASPNLGIAAYYDGMGYNPFHGKPIRAGFPPELPPVRTTVVNDGRSLHLAWESGYPGLRLLATPDLAPPVQWTPVTLASETEAVVDLPTQGQLFFRLVHEP